MAKPTLRTGLVPSPPTETKQRREVTKRPGTGDWQSETYRLLDEAKQQKAQSQQLRDLAVAVKKTGTRETNDQQVAVNGELKRKVAQTRQLKQKLEKQLASTSQELVLHIQERARTKEKLDARRRPLRVAEARVRERKERPNCEQINDAADRTLRQEAHELRVATEQLNELVKSSGEIIARLEHSRRLLQADLLDKTQSLDLDRQCLEVRHEEGVLNGGLNALLSESSQLVSQRANRQPEVWRKSTVKLIQEAAELEQQSVTLRKCIQKAVASLSHATAQAKQFTDEALKNKVKQTQLLHQQLTSNLRAVNTELDELNRRRSDIQQTLDMKQGPLNVIRQRLAIRKKRPEREAVSDGVEEALGLELERLRKCCEQLASQVSQADKEIQQLQILKRRLETECHNKATALNHDRRALNIDEDAVRSDRSSVRSGASGGFHCSISSARSSCSLPSIKRITPAA